MRRPTAETEPEMEAARVHYYIISSQTAAIREESEMPSPVQDTSGSVKHILNNSLCVG